MIVKLCLVYLVAVNILATFICIYDKVQAKKKKWRVPEKILFLVSFLGGATAMYFTMIIVRHKTKHKRFMFLLPLISVLQIVLFLYIINLTTKTSGYII